MIQALLAGVASIKAQQTRMNIIGSNLANVNTTAYKSASVNFEDMIAQTIRGASRPSTGLGGTNALQIGLGVVVGSTDTNNAQGSLNATSRPTDLAIQGNGFFMVSNGQGASYTRDGSFALDAGGQLVQRSTGQRLLGWSADAFGNIDSTQPITPQSALTIPLGSLTAVQSTKKISMSGNLNGGALPTDTWSTQVQVYDSLGGAHNATIQFTNHQAPPPAVPAPPAGAVSSWGWTAYEGSVATGVPIGSSTTAGNAPIFFDANGNVVSSLPTGKFNQITVPSSNGAPALAVSLDFGPVTQLNSANSLTIGNQNGFPPGSLQSFNIGQDGSITGTFTNGLTRDLGKVATAIFPNADGLKRIGSNLWQPTDNSGIAVVGSTDNGGRGTITSGFLEQSNVDIGNEFTDLIVTQRGFQANTKVVTTVDQMMAELMQMKQ